jgi:hypothetical protein
MCYNAIIIMEGERIAAWVGWRVDGWISAREYFFPFTTWQGCEANEVANIVMLLRASVDLCLNYRKAFVGFAAAQCHNDKPCTRRVISEIYRHTASWRTLLDVRNLASRKISLNGSFICRHTPLTVALKKLILK